MSLGVPLKVINFKSFNLALYSNPPYGYYVKKFMKDVGLSVRVSNTIQDYDSAVLMFKSIVDKHREDLNKEEGAMKLSALKALIKTVESSEHLDCPIDDIEVKFRIDGCVYDSINGVIFTKDKKGIVLRIE